MYMNRFILALGRETIATLANKINSTYKSLGKNGIPILSFYREFLKLVYTPLTNIVKAYVANNNNENLYEYAAKELTTNYQIDIQVAFFEIFDLFFPHEEYRQTSNKRITINEPNYDEIAKTLSTNFYFIKTINTLFNNLNTTQKADNIRTLNTLDELLAQDDKKGDYYYVTKQFYSDATNSRERPWIIVDGQLLRGQSTDDAHAMIMNANSELFNEESAYAEHEKAEQVEKPFGFGYLKRNVAVIDGTFGDNPPTMTEMVTILNKDYEKVYTVVHTDDAITRLAKRIKVKKRII